jgi:APA family basic amino acid/polyamine antiporter
LAALVLASVTFLNWIGLKTGSRAQEITSLLKALGLIALVIAAFTIPLRPGAASFLPSNSVLRPHSIFLGLLLALQGIVVTYDGWYAPIYFVEEDKDPAKNLPPLHARQSAFLHRNFLTGECGRSFTCCT